MTKKKTAPKSTKKAEHDLQRAVPKDPGSPAPEEAPLAEQSSTEPESPDPGAEPKESPAAEPPKESAETEAQGKPKAKAKAKASKPKPCYDGPKVKVGSVVRYWLPLAGATDVLIQAGVTKVHESEAKGVSPVVDLSYLSKAGVQTREGVSHVGADSTFATRTGKWCEMVDHAAVAAAAAETEETKPSE